MSLNALCSVCLSLPQPITTYRRFLLHNYYTSLNLLHTTGMKHYIQVLHSKYTWKSGSPTVSCYNLERKQKINMLFYKFWKKSQQFGSGSFKNLHKCLVASSSCNIFQGNELCGGELASRIQQNIHISYIPRRKYDYPVETPKKHFTHNAVVIPA